MYWKVLYLIFPVVYRSGYIFEHSVPGEEERSLGLLEAVNAVNVGEKKL